jgi:surfactin synthase thioesterase subunit
MTKMMCLPYAGAGAGVYRTWAGYTSDRLVAVPIQLPGREEEYTTPFYASIAEAAAGTATRIRAAAGADPFIIFGHSFGSILAYEAAHVLAATGGPVPERVIVSGSVSPRRRRRMSISEVSDEQAVADLREVIGHDIEALNHPELRELLLPAMRADIRLLGDYMPSTLEPLRMPLTAIRGDADAMAPVSGWMDWSRFTSACFGAIEMSGGHMFLTESWPLLWKTIEELA